MQTTSIWLSINHISPNPLQDKQFVAELSRGLIFGCMDKKIPEHSHRKTKCIMGVPD